MKCTSVTQMKWLHKQHTVSALKRIHICSSQIAFQLRGTELGEKLSKKRQNLTFYLICSEERKRDQMNWYTRAEDRGDEEEEDHSGMVGAPLVFEGPRAL